MPRRRRLRGLAVQGVADGFKRFRVSCQHLSQVGKECQEVGRGQEIDRLRRLVGQDRFDNRCPSRIVRSLLAWSGSQPCLGIVQEDGFLGFQSGLGSRDLHLYHGITCNAGPLRRFEVRGEPDLAEMAVPGIRFGVAFCEASGKCLVRWSGTDAAMVELATKNATTIGAGHLFDAHSAREKMVSVQFFVGDAKMN